MTTPTGQGTSTSSDVADPSVPIISASQGLAAKLHAVHLSAGESSQDFEM